MTLKVGDNVRVRFNMSKYNGMVEFANEVKAKGWEIPETFPIGYAYGTVIRKGFFWPSSQEKCPIAVVRFEKNQVVCNILNVSSVEAAICTDDGPDYYGARIIDDKGNTYVEPTK